MHKSLFRKNQQAGSGSFAPLLPKPLFGTKEIINEHRTLMKRCFPKDEEYQKKYSTFAVAWIKSQNRSGISETNSIEKEKLPVLTLQVS